MCAFGADSEIVRDSPVWRAIRRHRWELQKYGRKKATALHLCFLNYYLPRHLSLRRAKYPSCYEYNACAFA